MNTSINNGGGIALFVLLLLVVAVITTLLLHRYVTWRKTKWYALAAVWIGWFFSFSIVLLIPLDVSIGEYTTCLSELKEGKVEHCATPWVNLDKHAMGYLWRTLYWGTFILCWLIYPIMGSYVTSGEFTIGGRLRAAIKENLLFYIIGGVVLAVFLTIYAIRSGLNFKGLQAVAIAAANAWGLLVLILLLGYGLVDIPKRAWKESRRKYMLKYYQYQAAHLRENFEESKKQLDKTLKLIKKYSDKIAADDPFRPYIDKIIQKCPVQYKDIHRGEGEPEMQYSKLVNLHQKLVEQDHELHRTYTLYEMHLQKSFKLEDIINSRRNPEKAVRWSFRKPRSYPGAEIINRIEWFWRAFLEIRFIQLAALLCGGLSLVVIWSEVFFSIETYLSVFYQMVTKPKNMPFWVQWTLVFFPVLYISVCSFWTLFQLRLFNFYRLVPHHQSDANSIIFNAAYLCRLAAPLSYNFLLMINNQDSAFKDVMGELETATFLGKMYSAYFPIVLIILCAFTFFNLHNKILGVCCIKRFRKLAFDENVSDAEIERGRELLAHERELRMQGIMPPAVGTSATSASPHLTKKTTPVSLNDDDARRNSFDSRSSGDSDGSGSSRKSPDLSYPNFAKIFGRTPVERSSDTADLLERGERKKTFRW